WGFYVLHNIYKMVLGSYSGDPSTPGTNDQHFGAVVAFALSLIWVGRNHWAIVIRQAFRGRRYPERAGKYAPRAVAFWGLVACSWTMVAWLTVAGCTFVGACAMVLLLLTLFMVITRIVAEAGLVHGQLQVPIYKPWTWLSLAGFQRPVPMETFYLGAMLQSVHYDFREPMPVYTSHAFKMADVTADQGAAFDARQRRLFVWCLIAALFVGYWTTWGSTLWTEYTYATTQDERAENPINRWGVYDNTRYTIVDATVQYARGNYSTPHNPAAHFTFGALFTGFLSYMRLRFTWWPLHPIGYLMIGTYPGAHLWLSIFCGWLAKVTILRYGGTNLYLNAKPFFIGLIVGESVAAGFWLVMSIGLSAAGMQYKAINIMPG
ncbi:MAG TPA: DUF6785 family protein, partial [Tepidisphaeraceae bacterium]|nr:DUF6785 family protein [Tepidisphaeraceae bacterium]